MAFPSFAPPTNLTFVTDEAERKMDMALDDIIKMSRNSAKQQRRGLQYKSGQNYVGAKSKAVVLGNSVGWQKNVGAKPKAVVQANITAPSSSLRQKRMKQARNLSGYGYVTAKYAASVKAISAAPVTVLSPRNQSRIRKKPFLGRRRNLNISLNTRPRLLHPGGNLHQVYNNNPTGESGTLDSLFARMRKQRRVSHLRNRDRRFRNGGGM